jgi:putative membrane protein
MKRLLSAHGTRLAVLLASLIGLAVAVWMLGENGVGQVLGVVGRLGIGGLSLYTGYSLLVVLLLGGAWASAAPPLAIRNTALLFSWARLVREAAADILPFSQVGGLIVGIRLLLARRLSPPLIYASVVVDLTTEMAGQIVLTLFGIAGFVVLRSGGTHAELLTPIIVGALVMVALMALFFAAQRWAIGVAEALLGRLLPSVVDHVAGVGVELGRIYACRARVAAAFVFNLAAWVGSAAGAWIALALMGVSLSLLNVLVIESLIFALRSVAFAIPGGIGVQEAAYVLLGPLLGLPAEAALALSLAKRARDLAMGVPALVAWQISEARAIGRGNPPAAAALGLGNASAHNDRCLGCNPGGRGE